MGDIKLGISVNAFNCPYLTEKTLTMLRPYAHHVSVIIQDTSNDGQRLLRGDHYEQYLDLYTKGLVDIIMKYPPQMGKSRKWNETFKRNVGLMAARDGKCNVFMSMDEDEFYLQSEFMNALSIFWNMGVEGSVCKMQTYYKSSEYRLSPPEEYYVSLFFRLDQRRSFKEGIYWPFHVDPSRKMTVNRDSIMEFDRDLIQMHHMSYVRENIREKLSVQSASKNWPKGHIEKIAEHWDNWQYPYQACMGGMKLRYYDIEKVNDYFGV